MADTISELYSKYTGSVEEGIADDRYFQYLFEMVQAGDNTLEQTYRVLHKVVDETWISVVEDGLEAIFNIVEKPRRFIKSTEEVVPVSLAKKITAESVRHLSQNTQFIGTNAAGDIQPTHVLNVTTEESYDLYENRFVYHLIRRLFAFVDKRTDVIFWSTGDETTNIMKMETKVDDAYEQISYKVEMSIKNKQSLVENDTDNMDVFKRIDRVRRLSRVLRTSAFCEIMDGCAKVSSPIQRTNLMMKDPDYRTCYKLWQFIESYDEVGYSIEEQDSALEMDEEYMLQMYMNMIGNYTVFKSLIESDPRQMSEIAIEKREPVKPKFVKEIQEQIVENRDIPDVEIRKVFVEEVTEAQLEAEAKLEEETARCTELENSLSQMEYSLSDMQWQMESLSEQLSAMSDIQSQYEEANNNLTAELEEEKKAHEEALNTIEQVKADSVNEIESIKADYENRISTIKSDYDSKITDIRTENEGQIAGIRTDYEDRIADIRTDYEGQITGIKADYENQIAGIRTDAENQINEAAAAINGLNEELSAAKEDITNMQERIKELEAALIQTEADAKKQIADITAEKEIEIVNLKAEKDSEVSNIIADKDEQIKKLEKDKQNEINKIKNDSALKVENIKADQSQKLAAYKLESSLEIDKLKNEADNLRKALEDAILSEQKAIKKAEKNSLSHYILSKIRHEED